MRDNRPSARRLSAAQEGRLERFRREIAKTIPCAPNDDHTRAQLSQINLSDLVQKYLNWKHRFIPPRTRLVQFATDFWSGKALSFEKEIYDLANRMRRGDDVTRHLSDRVHTHGFVPAPAKRRRGIEWGDKDYALNVYGAHHLHLTAKGSQHLVYAFVSREGALFLLVGDHKSFDDGSFETAVLSARGEANHFVFPGILGAREPYTPQTRNRLARYGVRTIAQMGGRMVMAAAPTTAGTSIFLAMYITRMMRRLYDANVELDNPAYVKRLSALLGCEMSQPQWGFYYCDLCVGPEKGERGITIAEGPQ